MISDAQPAAQSNAPILKVTSRQRRWLRVAGWTLIALGVVVSWIWSVELTIAGEFVNASLAGAATFVLYGAGIVLIWRASPHRGRRSNLAFRSAVIASACGAVIAGITPVAVIAATTGTVTASVTSGTTGSGFTVADVAVLSSDRFHWTTLELAVHAEDRSTPQLVAIVSFADGTADVSCTNTRQSWTHDVSTAVLICDSFTPASTLGAISGIAVSEA